jgi:putative transposase
LIIPRSLVCSSPDSVQKLAGAWEVRQHRREPARIPYRQIIRASLECLVHFLRNLLAKVPKGSGEMVAAAIRSIFAQPDAQYVHEQLDPSPPCRAANSPRSKPCCGTLARASPPSPIPCRAMEMIWSTNPLERLNKKAKRRIDVVGVFPNRAALLRLAGYVLVEAHDEWQVAHKRYLSETTEFACARSAL